MQGKEVYKLNGLISPVKRCVSVVKRYDPSCSNKYSDKMIGFDSKKLDEYISSNKLICPVAKVNEISIQKECGKYYIKSPNWTPNRLPALVREQLRESKANDIKYIIVNRTCSISSNNRFICNYLFTQVPLWFEISNPFVFISSGTGTGKTTFVEQLIQAYGFRTLILTNRTIAREQLKNRLGIMELDENISVTSYQNVENEKQIDPDFLDSYDILVLDEVHYFTSDALVNNFVNASYEKIMATKKVVKICLSATISDIRWKMIGDILVESNDVYKTKERIFNYVRNQNSSYIDEIHGFKDLIDLVPIITNSLKVVNFCGHKKTRD